MDRARYPAARRRRRGAKGLRLGCYRGGSASGTWIGRRYRGGGSYDTTALGPADDLTDADAIKVLNFWQAQAAARQWAEKQRPARRPLRFDADQLFDPATRHVAVLHRRSEAQARQDPVSLFTRRGFDWTDCYPAIA
jgi:hypothetical protein